MKHPYFRRILISVLIGAILGLFCIIGVGSRLGYIGNEVYLIAMWYNRVIMGLFLGLSGEIIFFENNQTLNSILRGMLFGIIITTAIFLSTNFRDIPSFFAGIFYGVIIDIVSSRLS
jgi:hypothetical protein